MTAVSTAKMGVENPFRQPTDEEVFFMRDQERLDKERQRARLQYQRVHEKTTASARIGSATATTNSIGKEDTGDTRGTRQHGYLPGLSGTAELQTDKENMADFIAKKREMGLIRMSLSTKRAEIHKLETEAERAEKRIKQQEEQLEETSLKFDHFLKDNDMRAVEAMKKAEKESKGKNEKTGEIKKLTAHNAAVITEKTKYEEQLNACLRYKHDLDRLTPDTWFREALIGIRVKDERERLREVHAAQAESDSQEEGGGGAPAEDAEEKIEEQVRAFAERAAHEINEMPMSLDDTKDGNAPLDPMRTVRGQLDSMDPDKVRFACAQCY